MIHASSHVMHHTKSAVMEEIHCSLNINMCTYVYIQIYMYIIHANSHVMHHNE